MKRYIYPFSAIIGQEPMKTALLLNAGLFDPSRKIPDVARWLAASAYRPVSRASVLPAQPATITAQAAAASAAAAR